MPGKNIFIDPLIVLNMIGAVIQEDSRFASLRDKSIETIYSLLLRNKDLTGRLAKEVGSREFLEMHSRELETALHEARSGEYDDLSAEFEEEVTSLQYENKCLRDLVGSRFPDTVIDSFLGALSDKKGAEIKLVHRENELARITSLFELSQTDASYWRKLANRKDIGINSHMIDSMSGLAAILDCNYDVLHSTPDFNSEFGSVDNFKDAVADKAFSTYIPAVNHNYILSNPNSKFRMRLRLKNIEGDSSYDAEISIPQFGIDSGSKSLKLAPKKYFLTLKNSSDNNLFFENPYSVFMLPETVGSGDISDAISGFISGKRCFGNCQEFFLDFSNVREVSPEALSHIRTFQEYCMKKSPFDQQPYFAVPSAAEHLKKDGIKLVIPEDPESN